MAKYTPSYLDVSGFNKALTDQITRNAQINLRREQLLDSNIDQYLRSYTGKVRPQDMNKFNDYFNEWSSLKRAEMKLRRTGGSQLSQISMASNMAKQKLDGFSNNSRILGEMQENLGRMPKTNIKDTNQYQSTMADFAMLNADDMIAKHGGIDKIPQVFEFKPEKFNIASFQSGINSIMKTTPKQPISWVPAVDDKGQQMFEKEEFEISDDKGVPKKFSIDVPMKMYNVSVNPLSVRQAVSLNSEGNYSNKDFLSNYRDRVIQDASNQQDPTRSTEANDLISSAMRLYNISSVDNLKGEDLYAAFLTKNSDLGKVMQKDYDRLGDWYQMAQSMTGLGMTDARKKILANQVNNLKKNDQLRVINTIMNTMNTAEKLGLWGMDDTGDAIIDVINQMAPDLKIEKESAIKAYRNKLKGIKERATEIINQ